MLHELVKVVREVAVLLKYGCHDIDNLSPANPTRQE